eukprot:Skav222587  [mRNA]  locus=scaffold1897:452525:458125:- [translate_table: standard]
MATAFVALPTSDSIVSTRPARFHGRRSTGSSMGAGMAAATGDMANSEGGRGLSRTAMAAKAKAAKVDAQWIGAMR